MRQAQSRGSLLMEEFGHLAERVNMTASALPRELTEEDLMQQDLWAREDYARGGYRDPHQWFYPEDEPRNVLMDTLAVIAERVDARESRHIEDSLDHVWAQSDDLLTAWRECERRNVNFKRWVTDNIEKFKYKRACHYVKFRRTFANRHDKSDDVLWKEWQKISGNKCNKVLPSRVKTKPKPGPAPLPDDKRKVEFAPAITDEATAKAYYRQRDALLIKYQTEKTEGDLTLFAYERLYQQEVGNGTPS